MLNLFIGPPGGGKSYEAVVYHVLPALKSGRKVVTNLILFLDEICKIVPNARELIEFRYQSRGEPIINPLTKKPEPLFAFGALEDYGDPWRQEETGIGPLYVIDECHKALRRGRTRPEVEEWYAEHRHEGCDVLLITQSYGKVSKAIIDAVQVVYVCKKAVALGRPENYIRKVRDGVRGEAVDTAERVYEKRYFKLYKSHTKSMAGVFEAMAADINPAFKRWNRASRIVGALAFLWLIGVAVNFFFGDSPKAASAAPQQPAAARTKEHGVRPAAEAPAVVPVASETLPHRELPSEPPAVPERQVAKPAVAPAGTPFAGMGLHILGVIRTPAKVVHLVALSQNGQPVHQLNTDEIRLAGYGVEAISDCVVRLSYPDVEPWFIRCDLPQVGSAVRVGSSV